MRGSARAPNMNDQKNTILAIVLSAIVLIAWQYFVGMPQMEKQRQEAVQKAEQAKQQQTQQQQQSPSGTPQLPGQGGAPTASQQLSREAAINASGPRIKIETPTVQGTIALKGARIDDLALIRYRETVNPKSPPVVLLSPSGSPHPFYAEFGWIGTSAGPVKLPTPDT